MTAVELNTNKTLITHARTDSKKSIESIVDVSGYLIKPFADKKLPPLPKSSLINKDQFLAEQEIDIVSSKGKSYGKVRLLKLIELIKKHTSCKDIILAGSAVYQALGEPFINAVCDDNELERVQLPPYVLGDIDFRVELETLKQVQSFGNSFMDILGEVFPHIPKMEFMQEGFMNFIYIKEEGIFNLSVGNRAHFHFDFVAFVTMKRYHLFMKDALQYSLFKDTLLSDLPSPLQAPIDHLRQVVHVDHIETVDKHGWSTLQTLRLKGYSVPEPIDTALLKARKAEEIIPLLKNARNHLAGHSEEMLWLQASEHLHSVLAEDEFKALWKRFQPRTALSEALATGKIPFLILLSFFRFRGLCKGQPNLHLLAAYAHKNALDHLIQKPFSLEDDLLKAILCHPDRKRLLNSFKTRELIERNFDLILSADLNLALTCLREYHLPECTPKIFPQVLTPPFARDAAFFVMSLEEDQRKPYLRPLAILLIDIDPPYHVFKTYQEWGEPLDPELATLFIDRLSPLEIMEVYEAFPEEKHPHMESKIVSFLESLSLDKIMKPPFNKISPSILSAHYKNLLSRQISNPSLKDILFIVPSLQPSEEVTKILEQIFDAILNRDINEARLFLTDPRIKGHLTDWQALLKKLLSFFQSEPKSLAWELFLLALDSDMESASTLLPQVLGLSASCPPRIQKKVQEKSQALVLQAPCPYTMANCLLSFQVSPFPLNAYLKTHPLPPNINPILIRDWFGAGNLTHEELDKLLGNPSIDSFFKHIEKRIPPEYPLQEKAQTYLQIGKLSLAVRLAHIRPSLINAPLLMALRGHREFRGERFEFMKKGGASDEEWVQLLNEIKPDEKIKEAVCLYVYEHIMINSPLRESLFTRLTELGPSFLKIDLKVMTERESEALARKLFILGLDSLTPLESMRAYRSRLKEEDLSPDIKNRYLNYLLRHSGAPQEVESHISSTIADETFHLLKNYLQKLPKGEYPSLSEKIKASQLSPSRQAELLVYVDPLSAYELIKDSPFDGTITIVIEKLIKLDTEESLLKARSLYTQSPTPYKIFLNPLVLALSRYPSGFDFCLCELTKVSKQIEPVVVSRLFDCLISKLDRSEKDVSLTFHMMMLDLLENDSKRLNISLEGIPATRVVQVREIEKNPETFLLTMPIRYVENSDYLNYYLLFLTKLLATSTPSESRYKFTSRMIESFVAHSFPLKSEFDVLAEKFLEWIPVSDDPKYIEHFKLSNQIFTKAIEKLHFTDRLTLFKWRVRCQNKCDKFTVDGKIEGFDVFVDVQLSFLPPITKEAFQKLIEDRLTQLLSYKTIRAYLSAWTLLLNYQININDESDHTDLEGFYALLLNDLPYYALYNADETTKIYEWVTQTIIMDGMVFGHPLTPQSIQSAHVVCLHYFKALYKCLENVGLASIDFKKNLLSFLKGSFIGGGFNANFLVYFKQIELAIDNCYILIEDKDRKFMFNGFCDLIFRLPREIEFPPIVEIAQISTFLYWIETLHRAKKLEELISIWDLWLQSDSIRKLVGKYPTYKQAILSRLPRRLV